MSYKALSSLHCAVTRQHLTPELRLRLLDPASPLYRKEQNECRLRIAVIRSHEFELLAHKMEQYTCLPNSDFHLVIDSLVHVLSHISA